MLLGASTPCFVRSPNVPTTDNISEDKRACTLFKGTLESRICWRLDQLRNWVPARTAFKTLCIQTNVMFCEVLTYFKLNFQGILV